MNFEATKANASGNLIATRFKATSCMAGLLLLLSSQGSLFAQSPNRANNPAPVTNLSARHILGFEGVKKNAQGRLTVENDDLKFQKDGGTAVEVKTSSILSVNAGQEDKQVGGIPVVLGRAATPFGGGRAIALFSHKKYDTLTLEYKDDEGAEHGAVFQLAKGEAQVIQDELAAKGVHTSESQTNISKSGREEQK